MITALASRHPERPVFSRFIPPERPEQMPGMWQRYYRRWRSATREHLDLRLLDLMPPLAALCPPAGTILANPSSVMVGVIGSPLPLRWLLIRSPSARRPYIRHLVQHASLLHLCDDPFEHAFINEAALAVGRIEDPFQRLENDLARISSNFQISGDCVHGSWPCKNTLGGDVDPAPRTGPPMTLGNISHVLPAGFRDLASSSS